MDSVGIMRILHLTDTHLYADESSRHYDRIDTGAALVGVLERLGELEGIDLVVHAGDASEDGTEESYRRLHALLEPFAGQLGAPLVVAMGNHDSSAAYASVQGPGDHGGSAQDRSLALPGGERVITLDTSVPGAGHGHLEAEQLEWLRGVLATPADGGSVLVMHHPPMVARTPLLRALDLENPAELAQALEGSDVRIVLSGHYHHGMQGEIAGIPVHVAPGITNVMDPLARPGVEQAHPLSGASVVELDEGGRRDGGKPVTTTTVWPNTGETGDHIGPVYRFEADTVRRIIDATGRG